MPKPPPPWVNGRGWGPCGSVCWPKHMWRRVRFDARDQGACRAQCVVRVRPRCPPAAARAGGVGDRAGVGCVAGVLRVGEHHRVLESVWQYHQCAGVGGQPGPRHRVGADRRRRSRRPDRRFAWGQPRYRLGVRRRGHRHAGRQVRPFLCGDRHPRGFQRPARGSHHRGRRAAGARVLRQREGQSHRAEGHGHRREHGRPSGQRHVRLHRQRGGGTGRQPGRGPGVGFRGRRPRQGRPGAGGRAGCRRLDPLRHRRRHRCRRPDGSDGCARHARRCPPARRRRRQRAGRPLRPA